MIVRLSGRLDYVGEECVHVTIGEMTHELLVPAADIPFLQTKVGQAVSFFTLQYIEGNPSFGSLAPKMLGFLRADDKDFFDLFTTVKGIGTKKALKAFAIPVSQIAAAIALKDTRKLSSLPQIGKRAAEQIIAELHGKVERFAVGASAAVPVAALPDHEQQAIEVLVRLGERRVDAENWVHRAATADPALTDAQKIIQAVYRLKAGIK
ncbi:MAG TPA: Holliday junction branch migration protein RuvA [Phycisphaerae bacterium]|nr:Holliday junction branch migration protein RuvA [Phycisphaerae bacterium]